MRIAALSLILLASISTAVTAANLPAAEDSSSLKGKLTTVTNKATTLPVDGNRRAFVFFDLTELPANAQVRYARLRLYFPTVARAGGGLTLHTVTGQWNEGVASIEPTIEQTPLTTFAPTAVGAKRFVSVDVTDTVKAWLANPVSNEGFAIKAVPGATTKLTASVTVGAKEGSGTGYPAELEIELSDIPGLITSEQLAPDLTLGGTTAGTFSGSGAALQNLATSSLVGQIANTQLANSGFMVSLGDGLTGNNGVALGGTLNLSNSGVLSMTSGGGITVNNATGNVTLGSTATSSNVAGAIVARDGTGAFASGAITASSFTGDGAGVTNLNASSLASGTVPGARLAGTYGNALNLPNSGNTVTGVFTASGDADFQNHLLKNAAIGSILYHASFSNVFSSGNGSITARDGFLTVQTATGQPFEVTGHQTDIASALDKPGTFLSAVVRCAGATPIATQEFYLMLGTGGAVPSGFGFKVVGNALFGFTTRNSGELTTVDLQTSFQQTTQLSLLTIRRANAVDFYVNGVLKGSSTTFLPDENSIHKLGYVMRAVHGTAPPSALRVEIGALTIGYPMF